VRLTLPVPVKTHVTQHGKSWAINGFSLKNGRSFILGQDIQVQVQAENYL